MDLCERHLARLDESVPGDRYTLTLPDGAMAPVVLCDSCRDRVADGWIELEDPRPGQEP